MGRVPVFCNVLWDTVAEAEAAPRGYVNLAFCENCGLIHNTCFDERLLEYVGEYENSLHFSDRFQQYATDLVDRLVNQYGVRQKRVIEIGCGDGQFLRQICQRGDNRGYGFDPAYRPDEAIYDERVEIASRILSDPDEVEPADMVCCRHVLEHVSDPIKFLSVVRDVVKPDGVVYFEVPNVLYSLRDQGIWDIIFEHCLYFTPGSLANCFRSAGFEVLTVAEAYGGQFIGIEATANSHLCSSVMPPSKSTHALIEAFSRSFVQKTARWRQRLADADRRGNQLALWGAGSKGVTFLNVLGVNRSVVPNVIDINPRKRGKLVAGTGQLVMGPEDASRGGPSFVVVMNPYYIGEIQDLVLAWQAQPILIAS